jgi:serine/threonine protein kinase
MAVDGTDRNPVEVLSEEFLERIRRGEGVTPEEYAAKHPELADEILALFPALLMMEELGDETSDRTSSQGGQAGAQLGAIAGRLGEFRLLREVGRGGMGVVYEAEQESLGRRVALKVLPTGALTDLKQVRRFEREARSAARLHHTNIVPIFGVGEHEGTHYYVMQFIQGQGLDAVLAELKKFRQARETKSIHASPPDLAAERRGPAAEVAQSLVTGRFVHGAAAAASATAADATAAWTATATTHGPTSASGSDASMLGASSASGVSTHSETDRRFAHEVARIGVQVGAALAHAHGQGILHRDIKPSNLLLDREGNVWVTDFGLAKAVGGEDLTITGDIVGTLRYMAPERFQGAGDTRADIYSLGLTLYELLALRPAFDETDRASLIRQVTQEDPPRLRKLNRHVPPDCETIIHKAIARDPRQRYETAQALADDLQRFLDGRPILARRVSTSERLYRWARRNPALATSLGVFAILLVAMTVGSIIAAARFRNVAQAARLSAELAEVARKQADAARALAVNARRDADARRMEAERERSRAQASLAESQASLALAKKAVDDSFTKVSESALLNLPGLRPLRRQLLESALAFYEEFIRRNYDDPGVVADMAATQARVGLILSDMSEQAKAHVALRRAVELYGKALAARPNDLALLEGQSEVWHRLGDLDYRTAALAANSAYRKAIAIRERLAAEHPAEPRFRMALSRSFNGLALTTFLGSRLDAYRRSLELRLKLADEIPDDPDLLHGLSESFLNLGIQLWAGGHPEAAFELAKRSIDYGRAGLARRPHDFEFAMDLGASYTTAAGFGWQLGHREDALAISTDGAAYLRKLSADNPDVPSYRDAFANAVGAIAEFAGEMGRPAQAISSLREAALTLETKTDADAGALATASIYRARLAGLLAGDSHTKDFSAWPEAARREVDVAIADLSASVARGMRRADLIRSIPAFRPFLDRNDVKSLLVEMTRPPPSSLPARAAASLAAPRAPSPLDRSGRLEEDRLLGELTISLLQDDKAPPEQAYTRLESLLTRLEARRKSGPKWPALNEAARSIQLKIGARLVDLGRLAEARQLLETIKIGTADGPQASIDRGLLLAKAGQIDGAAADFARALELSPEALDIWGPRAVDCRKMAAHPEAYDRLLTLRSSDALVWYVRAERHLIRRDYQAAVADFAHAGEPPATTEFAYVYGAALLLAGDASRYRDYVVRQSNRHGDDSEWFTHYVLARLAMLDERPAVPPGRIVAWAGRAVEERPREAWPAHTQAMAFLRVGDNEAARKSVGISKSVPWNTGGQALNQLAEVMIKQRQGRIAEAREQFRPVTAVFDGAPDVRATGAVVLNEWLEFQVLRRQIEGPLEDAVFPADPFAGK